MPFDSLYEWQKRGWERHPYAALAEGLLMAMAGLWDRWRSPAGEIVRSFSIVATAANALLAPLHERMPVILDPVPGRYGSARRRRTATAFYAVSVRAGDRVVTARAEYNSNSLAVLQMKAIRPRPASTRWSAPACNPRLRLGSGISSGAPRRWRVCDGCLAGGLSCRVSPSRTECACPP